MIKNILIEENIVLKPLVQSDAQTMFNIINSQRDYLGEWLPFVQLTKEVKDSRSFVEMAIEQQKKQTEFVFKICYKDRMIGLIGTKDTDYLNKSTEIGYWLSKDYQGRGIVTRSVASLSAFLFKYTIIHRIQICCAANNKKSIAIPKRLGFTFEGIKRDGEWVDETTFRDLLIFSLLEIEQKSING